MFRGTTPTVNIAIRGITLSDYSDIWVTLEQRSTNIEITKKLSDGSVIVDATVGTVSVPLTQSETLSFAKGNIDIQLRAVTPGGTAIAGPIVSVHIDDILKDGEIS